MKIKKMFAAWILLLCAAVMTSGCALLGTALSAGVAYGLYQVTRK